MSAQFTELFTFGPIADRKSARTLYHNVTHPQEYITDIWLGMKEVCSLLGKVVSTGSEYLALNEMVAKGYRPSSALLSMSEQQVHARRDELERKISAKITELGVMLRNLTYADIENLQATIIGDPLVVAHHVAPHVRRAAQAGQELAAGVRIPEFKPAVPGFVEIGGKKQIRLPASILGQVMRRSLLEHFDEAVLYFSKNHEISATTQEAFQRARTTLAEKKGFHAVVPEELRAVIVSDEKLAQYVKAFDGTIRTPAQYGSKPIWIDYEHIFRPVIEMNCENNIVRVNGFHHDKGGVIQKSGLLKCERIKEGSLGTYTANISYLNSEAKPSSFFPDHWTHLQVIDTICEAIRNPIKPPPFKGNRVKFIGEASHNLQIMVILELQDVGAKLVSAYPVITV